MSLTIVPLLALSYYQSLARPPRLPASPSPLDHLRYAIHKSYYQYTVTFSGYMLDPAERILFDVLLAALLGMLLWGALALGPVMGRLVGAVGGNSGGSGVGVQSWLSGAGVEGWQGNLTAVRVERVIEGALR